MYGTSDRIGHRTIQRKSPSSEENLYVRKKTRKSSEENCIGYELHQHKERRPKLPASQSEFQESKKSIIRQLEGEEVPCKHLAFMATPVKRSKVTTMNDQSSEDSRDFDVTSESESEQEDSEAESNSSN